MYSNLLFCVVVVFVWNCWVFDDGSVAGNFGLQDWSEKKKCLYVLFYLAISRTFISFFLIFNSVISKSFEDVIILLLSLIQVYHPQKHVRTIFNGLKSIFQYLFYLTMIHIILVKFFKYSAKGMNIRFLFLIKTFTSTLKKGIKI